MEPENRSASGGRRGRANPGAPSLTVSRLAALITGQVAFTELVLAMSAMRTTADRFGWPGDRLRVQRAFP
ncbi:hypothetical protein ASF18_18950 [Methylobacterium sp. Leaf89]|nr:hypothetical protein ASF18_18950 [Methylobacterium sp. Leaf89]